MIKDSLCECAYVKLDKTPFVGVLTLDEWSKSKDELGFNFDMESDIYEIYTTKAEVNYDCLVGSFCIPDRNNMDNDDLTFAFMLDERCIIFVDDSGYVNEAINHICKTKYWKFPSLERFVYDFLDYIIKDDLRIMEKYELELEDMEDNIDEDSQPDYHRLNQIRSENRRFYIHYEQLFDLTQELDENENNFFENKYLRYFRSYMSRLERLLNTSSSIRDYVMQIEDMHREQINIKQNRIMTLLTVVTSIFMPLTLITGWYGMNFKFMPELDKPLAYPFLIVICIVIVVVSLYYFRKRKWL